MRRFPQNNLITAGSISLWLVLLLLPFCRIQAQTSQQVSPAEILSSFRMDSTYRHIQADLVWASQQAWRSGLFRQMEIRTETDRWEWNRQEFLFRISPRNPREIKLRNQQTQLSTKFLEPEQQALQSQLLAERYETLISLYFAQKSLGIYLQKKELLQRKLSILSLDFADENLDPVDLARTETALLKTEGDLTGARRSYSRILVTVQNWLGVADSLRLNWGDFIGPADIRTILDQESPFDPHLLPGQLVASLEVEDAFLDWQIEKTQQHRWIDFVQARVQGRDQGFDAPEVSLGLGLQLPLVREYKNQQALDELAWRTARIESQVKGDRYRVKETLSRQQLHDQLDQYEALYQQWESGHTRTAFQQLRQLQEVKAITLILLQEEIISQELLLLDQEEILYEDYFDWLENSGHLSSFSPHNYLSISLEEL